MDGGVPWTPDPMEAMDSMRGIISMQNPYQPHTTSSQSMENPYQNTSTQSMVNSYQPHTASTQSMVNPYQNTSTQSMVNPYRDQTTASQSMINPYRVETTENHSMVNTYHTTSQPMERTSHPTESIILMHNLFDPSPSQPQPAPVSMQQHTPISIPHHAPIPSPTTPFWSSNQVVENVYQPQISESMEVSSGKSEQNEAMKSEQNEALMSVGTVYQSPVMETMDTQNNIQNINHQQLIFSPDHNKGEDVKDGGEANQYYVPCGEAFDISELYAQADDSEATSNLDVSSKVSTDHPETVPPFRNENSDTAPQLQMPVGTGGDQKSKVMDDGGSKDVVPEVASPEKSIEEQMRAIHGPTPSPVPLLEEASTIISPRAAQDDLKTENNMMDDVLKNIFVGEDENGVAGLEDEEVANIMGSPENNFVNVSHYVVNQSIPLRFDPISGEMVPDIGTEFEKKVPEVKKESSKNDAFNDLFQQDKPKSSKIKNVAKVAPLPQNSPLQFTTIVSSSALPTSAPRQASSQKCSCLKHSVLGYPPSKVMYWKVRTTPATRKTVMEFDNEGVKFLYDDGCLKSFDNVLKSFSSEFWSSEQSLEVSLCLSCVRWAEGEAKEVEKKFNSKIKKSAKKKEKEILKSNEIKVELITDEEEKPRKRGRPRMEEVPETTKKLRTSSGSENVKNKKEYPPPEVVKKPRTSSDTENIYKKEYTPSPRRSGWIVKESKEEEIKIKEPKAKSPKVLMYDLLCDIPGCNAKLRGYPRLIKHFKAKHPQASVTPEKETNLDDKSLVSGGKVVKNLDEKDLASENEVDDKFLAFVNDPSKKLKAMEDMKLLNVKVVKLKNMPLPRSSGCLKDKRLTEIHSEPGQGKRKSVEFKETLEIHTISPRRKHETRRRGNESPDMLATIDLNSPPKQKIIKLNLGDDKNLPNTSAETIAEGNSESSRNSASNSLPKVPNLETSSESKIHSDQTHGASSSKIIGEKENMKVPKVMMKEIGIIHQNNTQLTIIPSVPDSKRKEIDKLRIDMVPEAISPMRGGRSTRGQQRNQIELPNQEEPDKSSGKNTSPSPKRSSRSVVAEVWGEKLKSPTKLDSKNPHHSSSPSPVRSSRSSADLKTAGNNKSPGRLDKASAGEAPQFENSTQARSTRGGIHNSPKSGIQNSDQNSTASPMRASRSSKTASPSESRKISSDVSSETAAPMRTSRSGKSETRNLSQQNEVSSPTPSNDINSTRLSRSRRSESASIEEIKFQFESKSSPVPKSQLESKNIPVKKSQLESKNIPVKKSQLDKLRIDMVPQALSPRRANRSSSKDQSQEDKSASKDQSQDDTQVEPVLLRTGGDQIIETGSRKEGAGELTPKETESVGTPTSVKGITRRSRRSFNLEEQKSPNNTIVKIPIVKATENNSGIKRNHDHTEVASSEPSVKKTRSGRLVMDESQQEGEKPSHKTKAKSSKQSNSTREETEEAGEKVIKGVELSEDAISSGHRLQDRSDGIKKVKEDLKKHLSLAGPLSVDDKKSLLEIAVVINGALLKNL